MVTVINNKRGGGGGVASRAAISYTVDVLVDSAFTDRINLNTHLKVWETILSVRYIDHIHEPIILAQPLSFSLRRNAPTRSLSHIFFKSENAPLSTIRIILGKILTTWFSTHRRAQQKPKTIATISTFRHAISTAASPFSSPDHTLNVRNFMFNSVSLAANYILIQLKSIIFFFFGCICITFLHNFLFANCKFRLVMLLHVYRSI